MKLPRLEGAHVGDHDLELGNIFHHPLEAGKAVVSLGQGAGADVNEQEANESEQPLIDREHPGIVGKKNAAR